MKLKENDNDEAHYLFNMLVRFYNMVQWLDFSFSSLLCIAYFLMSLPPLLFERLLALSALALDTFGLFVGLRLVWLSFRKSIVVVCRFSQ